MTAPLLLLLLPSHAAQPPGAPLDQLEDVAALTASVRSLLDAAEAAVPDAADVAARYEAVLDSHAGDTPLASASSAQCYDDALRALEDGTHWLLQEDASGLPATARLPGAQPQAEAALEAAEARERALLKELRRERGLRKRAEARAGAAARAGGRAARSAVRTSTSKGAKRRT